MLHNEKIPDALVGALRQIDDVGQRRNFRKLHALPALLARLAADRQPHTPPKGGLEG